VTPGSDKVDKNGITFNLPAVGLNDNLDFLGRQLHVQTEYIELPVARIVTQVFCSGRVMLSKKTECPPAIHEFQDTQKLQQIMNAQHHKVIQEITGKQARILGSH
jgi:hypothetical protein